MIDGDSHTTMIHAKCPNGGWDYYTLTFKPYGFCETEQVNRACDAVRGVEAYQEDIAEQLTDLLPLGHFRLKGMHSDGTGVVSTTCERASGVDIQGENKDADNET